LLGEVYCVAWEKCKYTGGVPLFVGGNERRIYERGLFSFRDRFNKIYDNMEITLKRKMFYLILIFFWEYLSRVCVQSP